MTIKAVIEVEECFDCPFHKRSFTGLPICKKKNLVLPHGALTNFYAGFRGALWMPRVLDRGRPTWCPLTDKTEYINSCKMKTE